MGHQQIYHPSSTTLISLYKYGSLGLAAYAYYKGALPGSYTPSKCLFYW